VVAGAAHAGVAPLGAALNHFLPRSVQ